MNILFIGALPDPITGQSLACQVFLDHLVRSHRVDVINLNKREFKQGMNSLRRVGEVLSALWKTWRLRRSADVIYLTISESRAGNIKDLVFYLLCYPQLERMYVHLHGGAGLRTILLGPQNLIRKANEFLLRRLAGVIVLGERHIDMFAHSVERSRIHVVPNFAQDYLFADEAAIRRKFAETAPLRVLFLSNLIPGKGYLELLEAVLGLSQQQRQRLRIDFAGGFESPDQEREFLGKIAAVPQIRYHGVVRGEHKRELFEKAHVFCLPTYYPYEGQPISILEAYASGCVVVTTDHSGIFDVFSPGTNGFAVGKRSVPDLIDVFTRMLEDQRPLLEIALTNFRIASRDFKPDTYCANLTSVLIKPVAAGSSVAC